MGLGTLLANLFGRSDASTIEEVGGKYASWRGPWLVYNGTKVPLDIPGVGGAGDAHHPEHVAHELGDE